MGSLEDGGEFDGISDFCMCAEGSPNAIVNVVKRELMNGAREHLEQRVFNVANEKNWHS